jgi:hypothetical protein
MLLCFYILTPGKNVFSVHVLVDPKLRIRIRHIRSLCHNVYSPHLGNEILRLNPTDGTPTLDVYFLNQDKDCL